MKEVPTSEGVKNPNGKDYPFSVSNILESENETAVEEKGRFDAERGTEETMLV